MLEELRDNALESNNKSYNKELYDIVVVIPILNKYLNNIETRSIILSNTYSRLLESDCLIGAESNSNVLLPVVQYFKVFGYFSFLFEKEKNIPRVI